LRERIAERARRQHMSQAQVIQAALDDSDRAAFWAEFKRTMTTSDAQADLLTEAESLHNADGLEPEDWSDHPEYPW
jgi:hypothetical protein